MTLKYKWNLRCDALAILRGLFTATSILIAIIVIRWLKFLHYGLAMYPGLHIPKSGMTLIEALHYFETTSIDPLLWWIPVTIALDLLIVLPVVRAYTK